MTRNYQRVLCAHLGIVQVASCSAFVAQPTTLLASGPGDPAAKTTSLRLARRRQGNSRKVDPLGWDMTESENFEYSIDSFLRGDYDLPFSPDSPAPYPGLTPGATIDTALRALRELDEPQRAHGAAVLLRFCMPLSRSDRWGGAHNAGKDEWKEILRGSLTPTMLANGIRASRQFACLLDWSKLDVTDGTTGTNDFEGIPSVAFVNAALYFEDGLQPRLIQFKLRRFGGVWLIDTVAKSEMKKLFVDGKKEKNK